MKSRFGGMPGNVNLKGKKYRLLSCRCCAVFDLRDRYERRRAALQIRQAKQGADL